HHGEHVLAVEDVLERLGLAGAVVLDVQDAAADVEQLGDVAAHAVARDGARLVERQRQLRHVVRGLLLRRGTTSDRLLLGAAALRGGALDRRRLGRGLGGAALGRLLVLALLRRRGLSLGPGLPLRRGHLVFLAPVTPPTRGPDSNQVPARRGHRSDPTDAVSTYTERVVRLSRTIACGRWQG